MVVFVIHDYTSHLHGPLYLESEAPWDSHKTAFLQTKYNIFLFIYFCFEAWYVRDRHGPAAAEEGISLYTKTTQLDREGREWKQTRWGKMVSILWTTCPKSCQGDLITHGHGWKLIVQFAVFGSVANDGPVQKHTAFIIHSAEWVFIAIDPFHREISQL